MKVVELAVLGAAVVGLGFLLAGTTGSGGAAPPPPGPNPNRPIPRPVLPGDGVVQGDTVTVALSALRNVLPPAAIPGDSTDLLLNVAVAGPVALSGPVIGAIVNGAEIAVPPTLSYTIQRSDVTSVRKGATA